MLSVFSKTSNEIDGIINAYSSKLTLKFSSNSDVQCTRCPFYRNCSNCAAWGAKNQYDWLEVNFGKDLLYITHYSITGKGHGQRAKGWNVDAKDKSEVSHRIDTVTEGLLPSNTNEVHEINDHGPFSSFKFTMTNAYGSPDSWYGHIFGIDFFGVLLTRKMFHNTCKMNKKISNSFITYVIICLMYP